MEPQLPHEPCFAAPTPTCIIESPADEKPSHLSIQVTNPLEGRFLATHWMDLPFLVMFLFALVTQVVGAIVSLSLNVHSCCKNPATEDYGHAAAWLGAMIGFALLFGIASVILLWFIPLVFIITVLILLIVGVPLIGMALAIWAKAWGWSAVMWVFSAVLCIWLILNFRHISKAAALIKACSAPAEKNTAIWTYTGFTVLLAIAYGYLVLGFTAGWRQGSTYTPTWDYVIGFLLVIWTSNIFKHATHCTSSRMAAIWFWQSKDKDGTLPQNPAKKAFLQTWSKVLGSVVAASLLRPLVGVASCWTMPLTIWLNRIANIFAFAYQTLYGKGYMSSSQASYLVLAQTEMRDASMAACCADYLLTLTSICGGFAVGGIIGLIRPSHEYGWAWFYGIGGFLVGTTIVGTILGVLSGCVASTWLCFAERHQVLLHEDVPMYAAIRRAAGLKEAPEVPPEEPSEGDKVVQDVDQGMVQGVDIYEMGRENPFDSARSAIATYVPLHAAYTDHSWQNWVEELQEHQGEVDKKVTQLDHLLHDLERRRR